MIGLEAFVPERPRTPARGSPRPRQGLRRQGDAGRSHYQRPDRAPRRRQVAAELFDELEASLDQTAFSAEYFSSWKVFGMYRHQHLVLTSTYIGPFTRFRTSTSRRRPPRRSGAMSGAISIRFASVRSWITRMIAIVSRAILRRPHHLVDSGCCGRNFNQLIRFSSSFETDTKCVPTP